MKTSKKSVIKMVMLTSASFAGYNIGSGFATGIEALQFFASWGSGKAYISITIALLVSVVVMSAVYITGYEQQFKDSKEVYRYFCGKHVGVIFDYYIYISMILVTLTMMSGAGATINQYSGLPTYVGSAIMGTLCIITSLLDLGRLRDIMSYLCILIIIFVFGCGLYAAYYKGTGPGYGSLYIDEFVAKGKILRSSAFGLYNPYLSGVASAGLLIGSGFAWASATGDLCRRKKEAALSGVFSPLFFYAATGVVVYLLLVVMEHVAGKEVPMLAVVQHLFPALSVAYSVIIVIAIFSTISGRLFLIGERYGGDRKRTLIVVTGITIFASAFASIIPFSKVSNFMFSICGAIGIIFGGMILVKFFSQRFPSKMSKE